MGDLTPEMPELKSEAALAAPAVESEASARGGASVIKPWLQNYPEGVRPTLDYPGIPLQGLLDNAARDYPEKVATVFFGGKITYRQLKRQADSFAAALVGLGVKPGDRLAIMLPNCPQCLIAYYGALKAGAVVVQFNPLYVEREIQYQLADSEAEVMVLLDLLYPRVNRVKGQTSLKKLVVTSIKDYLPFPLNLLYPIKAKKDGHVVQIPRDPEIYGFKDLITKYPPNPPELRIDPDKDIALLQYTGGTTGISKGAMLTHKNLVANVYQVTEWFVGLNRGSERIMAALPFFHVYGMTVSMNFSVAIGAMAILLPKFDVDAVLKLISKWKPTLFPGAPTMYVAVNNHPRVAKYDLSSVSACISGAAPLPVEVQEQFERLTGGKLVEGYGLTEAAPVTHCTPLYGKRKLGSIGLPMPDTEYKIMDLETGLRELPAGEIGELVVRGPQVMAGYWNRPDETAIALRDGWLYTGDIARMDEEGYTFIVDRKKDMIIAGGFNIYPRDVEEVLYEHPSVREAAVAGIKNPYRGETVKAYIVLKDGASLTAEEVITFCRGKMAKYKCPTQVEFRDSLPKTLIGKVLRRVLIEEETEKAQDRGA